MKLTFEEKVIKYIEFIAKHQCGCAPSVGYFEEIILKARDLLKEKNQQLTLF